MNRGLGIICFLLFILFIYFYKFYTGVSGFSNPPNSLPSVENYLRNKNKSELLDLPLSEFYINSSHNSYLDDFQIGGNASSKNTASCIFMGARCIELDIHANNKSSSEIYYKTNAEVIIEANNPVVIHGNASMTDFTKASSVDDHFSTIADNAFRWTNDPLILYLEIFDADNETMMRILSGKIQKYLGNRLYETRMSDLGSDPKKYLPNVPMRNLLGKICIVINFFGMNIGRDTGGGVRTGLVNRNRYLFPVCHATTDEPDNGWLGNRTLARFSGQDSGSGFKNKFNEVARVFPKNVISSSNYGSIDFFDYGYSIASLNFGRKDYAMDINQRFFKNSNILPKNWYENNNRNLDKIEIWNNTRLIKNSSSDDGWLKVGYSYSEDFSWKVSNIELKMQWDGNLVIYKNGKAQWSSKTFGNHRAILVMQYDGNLVIYPRTGGRALWASGTHNKKVGGAKIGGDGRFFIMQQDRTNSVKLVN